MFLYRIEWQLGRWLRALVRSCARIVRQLSMAPTV
ncbi:hypothetical protein KPSA3_01353 [Pseudomonas syringae pv. actinidiae]|uniref:Uncharacterized protein n=1 Tax=Pseudomonas syringae pv. actinidiae TaxID=103796 RepID=A0AAN4Q1D7_PSESF|nr:hypothetical protein KPSA3_01353 [Pseudomonas syringae pv. actinidiae]